MRLKLLLAGLGVFAFGLLLMTTAASAQGGAVDKALAGEWKAIWFIPVGEQKRPPGDYEDKSITFFPKKGAYRQLWMDGEERNGTFTSDASKNPHHLNLLWDAIKTPWPMIYKIEGDELWIAHGAMDVRPTSFSGKKLSITIYKRNK
jgi:uncharacterized protein (TIGR03067 family)